MKKLYIASIFFGLVYSHFCLAQTASYFEGLWDCEVIEKVKPKSATEEPKAVNFQWEAKLVMDGQWVMGQTKSDGTLMSTDFWRVEKNGQPSFHRVFVADGSFVESDTKGWWKNTLKADGTVLINKKKVLIRETLRRIDDKKFHSTWDKKIDGKWVPQSKETCERSKQKDLKDE